MAAASPVAGEFAFEGRGAAARTGVLLLHGFTGSPFSMRPLADAFAADGRAVRLPLLPGHGTSWRELNTTDWRVWDESAQSALTELRSRCDRVVVGGISMGGALALRLAALSPGVSGLVLIDPAVLLKNLALPLLPVLHRFVPSIGAIADDIKLAGRSEMAYPRTPLRALHSMIEMFEETRPLIRTIEAPALLFTSAVDHVVPRTSGTYVWNALASRDKERVILPESFHVATLDNDAPEIVRRSRSFVDRLETSPHESA